MTKIARMTPTIPRGTVIGKRTGGLPLSEADHFHKCEACGRWFDMRDLGAVLDHEEALPHPGFCNGPRRVNPLLRYPLAGDLLLSGIGAGPSPDGVHERNRSANLRTA